MTGKHLCFRPLFTPRSGPVLSPARTASGAKLRALAELAPHGECRFPVEESAAGHFLFCAASCDPAEIYCTHHRSIAYVR